MLIFYINIGSLPPEESTKYTQAAKEKFIASANTCEAVVMVPQRNNDSRIQRIRTCSHRCTNKCKP